MRQIAVNPNETYFFCPFHNSEFGFCRVNHMKCFCCRYDDDGLPTPGVPDGCPLAEGAVVVQLVVG